MTNEHALPDELLAFLSGSVIDPALVDAGPGSGPAAASAYSDSSASRPLNFSSAFSQSSSSRARPTPDPNPNPYDISHAVATSEGEHGAYSNPITADAFSDFGFLTDDIAVASRGDDGGATGEAGPGPSSIAAAVARNGILGLEQYTSDLPVLPPPSDAFSPAAYLEPASASGPAPTRGTATNRQEDSATVTPAKRKRGRPRTKPEKDPNAPPKKRGRPRKNPLEPELPLPSPVVSVDVSDPEAMSDRGGGYFLDPSLALPDPRSRTGSVQVPVEGGYSSEASQGSSSRGEGGGATDEEGREGRRGRQKRKKAEPPLVPRVFRLATKMRNTPMEDLDVHDLGRRVEEAVPEVTEEQKRELQRAMNP
ncbi:hypothetical protein JCM11491_000199, partial [Sporobolomyces phaffii]